MSGYRKHTEWRFNVCGEEMSVWWSQDGLVCKVEETRKNGQEDCHMTETLVFTDGSWDYDEEDDGTLYGNSFRVYRSQSLMDGVRDYLNQYPRPEEIE